MEEAHPYQLWAFDCPMCGGQTTLGDADPTGTEFCADCEEEVEMVL